MSCTLHASSKYARAIFDLPASRCTQASPPLYVKIFNQIFNPDPHAVDPALKYRHTAAEKCPIAAFRVRAPASSDSIIWSCRASSLPKQVCRRMLSAPDLFVRSFTALSPAPPPPPAPAPCLRPRPNEGHRRRPSMHLTDALQHFNVPGFGVCCQRQQWHQLSSYSGCPCPAQTTHQKSDPRSKTCSCSMPTQHACHAACLRSKHAAGWCCQAPNGISASQAGMRKRQRAPYIGDAAQVLHCARVRWRHPVPRIILPLPSYTET